MASAAHPRFLVLCVFAVWQMRITPVLFFFQLTDTGARPLTMPLDFLLSADRLSLLSSEIRSKYYQCLCQVFMVGPCVGFAGETNTRGESFGRRRY